MSYDIKNGVATSFEYPQPDQTPVTYAGDRVLFVETSKTNLEAIFPRLSPEEKCVISYFHLDHGDKLVFIVPSSYSLRLAELGGFTNCEFRLRDYHTDGQRTSETRFLDLKYLETVKVLVEYGVLREAREAREGNFYIRGAGKGPTEDRTKDKGIFFFDEVDDTLLGAIEYLWR